MPSTSTHPHTESFDGLELCVMCLVLANLQGNSDEPCLLVFMPLCSFHSQ